MGSIEEIRRVNFKDNFLCFKIAFGSPVVSFLFAPTPVPINTVYYLPKRRHRFMLKIILAKINIK